MKKVLTALTVFTVLAISGCSGSNPRETGEGPGVTSVMVAGDSLAAGMYATTQEDSFVSLVAKKLRPAKVTRVAKAHQTLAVVSSYTDVPEDVDVAIIELGTNDVGAETPEDEFRDGYEALLAAVRATSPDATLICAGTWTGWGWKQDEIIRSACFAADGEYVHLRDLFDREELRGPEGNETFLGEADDFHPNDRGHAMIANRILDAIDKRS